MSENVSKNNAALVLEAARNDYAEWKRTGDDTVLTRLIGHLFTSLEIENFDAVYASKGDAAVIKDDFGIDSLTLAEILFYTEDLLSIRIPNEDVAKLVTIGDLKSYLAAHRGDSSAQ
jgi:acyl carrier protein